MLLQFLLCTVAGGTLGSPSAPFAPSPRPAAARSASISSKLVSVGVSVLDDGSAFLDMFSFFGAGNMTANLPLQVGVGAKNGGSSLVLPAGAARDGDGALVPKCAGGCTLTKTKASVTLANMTLPSPEEGGPPLATETWRLVLLNASALEWTVDRTWLRSDGPALAVDRLGISFLSTGGAPIHAHQIPSFVDLEMFLDDSTTGGYGLGTAGGSPSRTAYEYLSPNQRQYVRFSPTGATFVVEGRASLKGAETPLFWSFAKPFADGTTWSNIGFEAIDPRGAAGGPRPAATAGTEQHFSMKMHLISQDIPTAAADDSVSAVVPPAHAFPSMDVHLPNATLQAQMAVIMGSQYQLMGWIMGNNPASSPCLHEMALWPLMTSLFPAGSTAFAAMQQELSFFATCGFQAHDWAWDGSFVALRNHSCKLSDGAKFGLSQRYAASGFYNAPWGPLQDQNVMFPIAVYQTAASTGDLKWLATMRPALDAIAKYLGAHGLNTTRASGDGTPVVFVSPASGRADGKHHASNWYDVIEFGHLDALLASYGVWGLQCLGDIYEALGDPVAATKTRAIHRQAVIDFNKVFWNSSSASYHDWIDDQGGKRSYFYVDVAFVAIIAGVASPTQTTALLQHYDARLADIYTEYDVLNGSIWSPPANLYPVTDKFEYANEEEEFPPGGNGNGTHGNWKMTFPMYENGGGFFHSAGLQYAALGVAGRADEAVDGFSTLMNSGFGKVRGWAQQLWWSPGGGPSRLDPAGGDADPLNTAALSVWGVMRAGFGVGHSLLKGVIAVHPPAKSFEGAQWNVSVLGHTACLRVGRGVTTFCNGTAISEP